MNLQAGIFSALAHPMRLKILEKLRSGACCVCRIIPYVGGEQSNVSHHLAILKRTGMVRYEKKGLEVWYEVTDQKVFAVIDLIKTYCLDLSEKSAVLLRELQDER
jgi:DNA-binding transcriptional ArsR family regulator